MIRTINELKRAVFPEVYNVYDIFQNHFGEDFTDLQGIPGNESLYEVTSHFGLHWDTPIEPSEELIEAVKARCPGPFYILVWWPIVTVTNENDRSVTINDLYAKVTLTKDGQIPYENRGFQLTKSTFSLEQFKSGYVHSHIPRMIWSGGEVPGFDSPCLGHGPINGTILSLKNGYNELTWMLFCEELSRYVTVESLTGGPYFRMEEIGSSRVLKYFSEYNNASSMEGFCHPSTDEHFRSKVKEFTLWYLQHGHFSLNFEGDRFRPGMSYYDYMIDISNAFIEWFNENGDADELSRLYANEIIVSVKAAQGKFYGTGESRRINPADYEGKFMFTFKGREVRLHIGDSTNENGFSVTLLHHNIAMFILKHILRTINYHYKNGFNKHTESGQEENTPRTCKKTLYL